MDLNEFKSKIKSGEIFDWYIFAGEEDYLKRYYLKMLRDAVITDEAFMPFNYVCFNGDEIDFAAVSEAIKSPPMMSDFKLIEWQFANFDGLKENELSALVSLFEMKEEYPYAIFAVQSAANGFDAGTAKKPTRLAAKLSEGFSILNFPKSTDSQLLSWLKKHFDAEKVSVGADALNMLIFRSGHSMNVLNNEVSKLCCYAKANGRSGVTVEDVEKIASPTLECDAFALSNAVLEKNTERAFTALSDLKQRRIEPYAVIAMLERVYSELASVAFLLDEGNEASEIEQTLKFHPFKTKLYISAVKKISSQRLAESLAELCRIDASSKSGGITGYGAIEMFVTKHV